MSGATIAEAAASPATATSILRLPRSPLARHAQRDVPCVSPVAEPAHDRCVCLRLRLRRDSPTPNVSVGSDYFGLGTITCLSAAESIDSSLAPAGAPLDLIRKATRST